MVWWQGVEGTTILLPPFNVLTTRLSGSQTMERDGNRRSYRDSRQVGMEVTNWGWEGATAAGKGRGLTEVGCTGI